MRREMGDRKEGQVELSEMKNSIWNKKYTGWNYSG